VRFFLKLLLLPPPPQLLLLLLRRQTARPTRAANGERGKLASGKGVDAAARANATAPRRATEGGKGHLEGESRVGWRFRPPLEELRDL